MNNNSIQNQFRLSGSGFERPPMGVTEAKRVIFISAEGTKTEPSYFKRINDRLKENKQCPFIIHVLEHDRDTASSPDRVLELLEECRQLRKEDGEAVLFKSIVDRSSRIFSVDQVKTYFFNPEQLPLRVRRRIGIAITKLGINVDYYYFLRGLGSSGDSFAVVIDRDPQGRLRSELKKLLDVCQKQNIDFCLSNPCFDFWLILHFDYHLTENDQKDLLSNKRVSGDHSFASRLLCNLAHHKKKIKVSDFNQLYLHKTKKALRMAKRFAIDETDVLDKLGTRVPVIIERIVDWL